VLYCEGRCVYCGYVVYDKIEEGGEGREHRVGVKKCMRGILIALDGPNGYHNIHIYCVGWYGMVWAGAVRERDYGYGNVGSVCLL
jgi:hypothetical protein